MKISKSTVIIIGLFVFFTSGCNSQTLPQASESVPSPSSKSTVTAILPTFTPGLSSTETIIPSPETATPTLPQFTETQTPAPAFRLCSPLDDITLEELDELVTNPFAPPRLGYDDGHQGTDFSFYRHGQWVGMQGLPVHAMLPGKVISVVINRPPYGFMVIIETEASSLPTSSYIKSYLPPSIPTVTPPNLTCPNVALNQNLNPDQRSIYTLYAHLNQLPLVSSGQIVQCGEAIGEVGTTGNSVNPHLHLEVRVGPSGASINSMAHYIGDATQEEMAAYCQWRVSGLFQMIDPMNLIKLQP